MEEATDMDLMGEAIEDGLIRAIAARIADMDNKLRRQEERRRALDDDLRAVARADLERALNREPGLTATDRRWLGLTVVTGIRLDRSFERCAVAYCIVRAHGAEAVLSMNPEGSGWTLRTPNSRAVFVQAGRLRERLVDFIAATARHERDWRANQTRARRGHQGAPGPVA